MPLIELDNAGAIGLVKDLKRSVMPVEAWDDLINTRCRENVLQSIGVDEVVYKANGEAFKFLMEVRQTASQYWIMATNGKLFKTSGISNPIDITKVATTYGGIDDSVWSGVNFHQQRILNVNSGSDLPQHINDAASLFVDLPNWPAAHYCKWFSAYKNFLLAFNITDGAGTYPSRIKWSDLADTGQLPGSWDETDPSTLAGENDIMAKGGGQILASRILNDIMYIYKDNGIWFMYPSNNIYVFNFKEMEDRQGLIGSHAITSYQGNHYCVIAGDVVINNGQRLASIIDKSNRNYLFDNIHADYFARTQIVANYRMNELWVCFPNQDSTGTLNEALIWNVSEKTWSSRELNEFSYLASGIIDTSTESQIIDDDSGIIDDDASIIDAINYNPTIESILAAKPTTTQELYQLDGTSGILPNGKFVRQGLTMIGRDRFNNWKYSAASIKLVTRVYPKFTGSGSFNVYIGFSVTTDGAVVWSSPEVYTIGGRSHVDFLMSGEAIALRIEALSMLPWEYSGADIQIEVIAENTP